MAASDTEICNLALSHLGNSVEIASLDEKSNEARACKRFYEQARDELLRDFVWPFATVEATLALVATSPTEEWGYAYRYPSDALRLIRIRSGAARIDSNTTLSRFAIGGDDAGPLLYADSSTGQIEYVQRVTDVGRFPPDFVSALSFLLAAYIAPRVTAGDPTKLGERAMQKYLYVKAQAQANALNEAVRDEEPDGGLLGSRL